MALDTDGESELRRRLATSTLASASTPDLPSFRRRTSRLSLDSQLGLPTPERTPEPSPGPDDDDADEPRTPGGSQTPPDADLTYGRSPSPETPRAWRASSPVSDISELDSPRTLLNASLTSDAAPARRRSARDALRRLPTSLLDYLANEVRIADPDGETNPDAELDAKAERITNFLSVPGAVERVIWVGMMICLDAFLHTFTILPLRFSVACYRLASNVVRAVWTLPSALTAEPRARSKRRRLPVSAKVDLVKGALILVSCTILHRITDASQMYHSVRGQDNIKLYVIFNVLEVRACTRRLG